MRVRGQALVEALAATLVLTPLLFAIVQLVALQSTQQATLGAARTAALAAHQGLAGEAGPLQPARVGALFFPSEESAADVRMGDTPQPVAAAQSEDVALTLILPARVVGVGDLDLGRSGAVAARVAATAPLDFGPLMPDATPLRVSATLPVMFGDWDAAGASVVWRRTAALSTTGRIAAWRTPLTAMAAPMRLVEPAMVQLCLGRIDPDIVPADRLRGVARPPDLRTQPC
jgi:hypothetical protein